MKYKIAESYKFDMSLSFTTLPCGEEPTRYEPVPISKAQTSYIFINTIIEMKYIINIITNCN